MSAAPGTPCRCVCGCELQAAIDLRPVNADGAGLTRCLLCLSAVHIARLWFPVASN